LGRTDTASALGRRKSLPTRRQGKARQGPNIRTADVLMDTKPIYDYPTRETILLATSYYHITLTVPHHGRPPCRGGGVKAPMTRKISKMHKLGANQVPTNLLRTVIVHFTRLTYWLISGSNADFGFAAPYSFITVYLWLHSCLRNLWLLNFLEMCIGLE